jgi:predicted MFS family arabinose efflux permease
MIDWSTSPAVEGDPERVGGAWVIRATCVPVAALFEKRLKPLDVGIAGVTLQAVLALLITWSTGFWVYAIPTVFYAALVIFSHTFLFGFLAKADPTGRAVAATPAMTMSGSAIAPLLGGFLSDAVGYRAIGLAVTLSSAIAVTLFLRARTSSTPQALPAVG